MSLMPKGNWAKVTFSFWISESSSPKCGTRLPSSLGVQSVRPSFIPDLKGSCFPPPSHHDVPLQILWIFRSHIPVRVHVGRAIFYFSRWWTLSVHTYDLVSRNIAFQLWGCSPLSLGPIHEHHHYLCWISFPRNTDFTWFSWNLAIISSTHKVNTQQGYVDPFKNKQIKISGWVSEGQSSFQLVSPTLVLGEHTKTFHDFKGVSTQDWRMVPFTQMHW